MLAREVAVHAWALADGPVPRAASGSRTFFEPRDARALDAVVLQRVKTSRACRWAAARRPTGPFDAPTDRWSRARPSRSRGSISTWKPCATVLAHALVDDNNSELYNSPMCE